MKHVMVIAAALLALVCVLPAADAASIQSTPGDITIEDNESAVIAFDVYSDSGFEMTVTVREGSNVVSEQTVQVQPGRTTHVEISLGGLSVGTHQYRVECTGDFPEGNGFNVTVNVDQSLLSNWVTYAAIIVVVIVVVIFAYIKMRDTPKVKPEMTFEELEAQRKAEMAEKAEKKQRKPASSSSTERRRFEGRKKDSTESPAEKPRKKEETKPTFEELEAQKQAEKAAKAEKKQKSTGLTERERYLEEKRKKKD